VVEFQVLFCIICKDENTDAFSASNSCPPRPVQPASFDAQQKNRGSDDAPFDLLAYSPFEIEKIFLFVLTLAKLFYSNTRKISIQMFSQVTRLRKERGCLFLFIRLFRLVGQDNKFYLPSLVVVGQGCFAAKLASTGMCKGRVRFPLPTPTTILLFCCYCSS
jgi:hypothetical protein